jgi:hypothetical protein
MAPASTRSVSFHQVTFNIVNGRIMGREENRFSLAAMLHRRSSCVVGSPLAAALAWSSLARPYVSSRRKRRRVMLIALSAAAGCERVHIHGPGSARSAAICSEGARHGDRTADRARARMARALATFGNPLRAQSYQAEA